MPSDQNTEFSELIANESLPVVLHWAPGLYLAHVAAAAAGGEAGGRAGLEAEVVQLPRGHGHAATRLGAVACTGTRLISTLFHRIGHIML